MLNKKVKGVVLFLVIAAWVAGGGFWDRVQAEDFPTREVELIVAFSAGGGTDMVARILGPKLSEFLKVPVVVVNKPGASGSIAVSFVISNPDDGYRVFSASTGNMVAMPASGAKLPYTLKDIAGIAMVDKMYIALGTKKGRFNHLNDLIKEAKQKPGVLTYGSYGINSPGHYAGNLVSQSCGIKMKHVPFEGGSKAMVAMMGGHVDISFTSSATILSNVRGGLVTCLATPSENRLEDLPDTPTFRELGYADVVLEVVDGYATSAKVPKERLEILRSAFEKAFKTSEVQNAIRKTGQVPHFMNGREFELHLVEHYAKLKEIAVKAGMVKAE